MTLNYRIKNLQTFTPEKKYFNIEKSLHLISIFDETDNVVRKFDVEADNKILFESTLVEAEKLLISTLKQHYEALNNTTEEETLLNEKGYK